MELMEYLTEIANTASALIREKMEDTIAQLEELGDEKLTACLDKWIDQMPVLTFNGLYERHTWF